jgi:general stress protein 26
MHTHIEKAVASTKKFVHNHKVAIAVTVTAAAGLALNKRNMNVFDDFLKEHDLYEEFYTPSDEE